MKDAQIHLYVHGALKDLASMIAQKEDKSLSRYIESLIREDAVQRGLMTPQILERLLA